MRPAEEARGLLSLMEDHVRALEGMNDPEIFADAVFGFHAQQAVELAFKAWLALHGVAYPRTHDLGALLNLLREGGTQASDFRALIELNAFAVQFRYFPMNPDEPTLDRVGILARVVRLRDHVADLIRHAFA
jgi:HEPN domain-containing protein